MYSIITINYNNELGLRRTIESVVRQTYEDYEYIIIDGGSTDSSVKIIQEYSDKIDFWVSERDRGIYHAMNKGVTYAHGDYCIFMNSGDCFYDEAVLSSVANYNNKEDVVVGYAAIKIGNGIISPPPKGEFTFYHLYSGAIPHQATFIKTELLRKYPYDESLKISSDWKFFVQALILDNCSIRYLDVCVVRYDTDGISSANPQMMRREKETVMSTMFPPRVLADYQHMKESECLVQTIAPQLRRHYKIDKLLYKFGSLLLNYVKK
jgi:glycosyltransferase involved in cell wall biosynthesis